MTSKLDLRQMETALKGGTRGAALVPGNSSASLLYQAVARTGALKMPLGKDALAPADVAILREWIDAGAKWPAVWWAFQPLHRASVPTVAGTRNLIDAFVLDSMAKKGLTPAPPAGKLTLVRRAHFDLIGLPPTPAQVKVFMDDASPDAFAKLVDQLLASPQYGERWGRFWLDTVRYADSSGFEGDLYYANAWRYRDYVIQSFNEDKPYDEFVKEQIAADEIWPAELETTGGYDPPKEKARDFLRRIGTGLYAVGPMDFQSGLTSAKLRYEQLSDMVDVTGSAFLGLSIACARCHDHKFDPLPQKDYYRLMAIFAGSEARDVPITAKIQMFTRFGMGAVRWKAAEEIRAAYGRQLKSLSDKVRRRVADKRKGEQPQIVTKYPDRTKGVSEEDIDNEYTAAEKAERDSLYRRIAEAFLDAPAMSPTATVLTHTEIVPEVHVAVRGEYASLGALVGPGFPSALSDGRDLEETATRPFVPQRRKALALWLARAQNPLFARVMVNRIWQGHFGRGIVATANDFGRQGEPPTHPELLDWLAVGFTARGWSIKTMHRMIMLSDAYQRSDEFNAANGRIDPDNHYLWRMNRRRMEAEEVRDAMLSVAGTLNLKAGGPPVIPKLDASEMSSLGDPKQWPPTPDPREALRRSVYLYVKRNFRVPLLEIFDLPDAAASCARRDVTNVAPQALALLNNAFVMEQAEAFAGRLMKDGPKTSQIWIDSAWRMALGRAPTARERQNVLGLFGADPKVSLRKLGLLLFNLNEFIYVD